MYQRHSCICALVCSVMFILKICILPPYVTKYDIMGYVLFSLVIVCSTSMYINYDFWSGVIKVVGCHTLINMITCVHHLCFCKMIPMLFLHKIVSIEINKQNHIIKCGIFLCFPLILSLNKLWTAFLPVANRDS